MNKCLFLLIAFFIIKCHSFGQTITIYDGSKFNVGDSLTIGLPFKNRSEFSYIKIFDKNYYSNYKTLDSSFTFKTERITDVKENNTIFWNKGKLVEVGVKGIIGYQIVIDIENAVRYGEVVCNFYSNIKEEINKRILKEEEMFLLMKKYENSNIDNNFIEEYLRRFDYLNYQKIKQNEFEYQREIPQIKTLLENTLNKIDIDNVYVLKLDGIFGNYDFNNKVFPVKANYIYDNTISNPFVSFNKYQIVFSNYDKKQKMNCPEHVAEKFLKRRDDGTGSINREVILLIYFKTDNQIPTTKRIKGKLYANIEKIEVYDFNEYYNLIGTIR